MAIAAALALAAGGAPFAQAPTALAMLDRYARGEFEGVAASLHEVEDFGGIYKDLRSEAPAWIDAGGPDDRARRRLAAATFALEASRAGELDDWKLVQNWMRLENIYWHAPAQLLEWGCRLLRQDVVPEPIEHTWQLAALAVAERAEDFEFLIGSPWEARANTKDEIEHLKHVAQRFPTERRFALGQGIAIEWRLFPSARRAGLREAQQVFESLLNDSAVGAEASMRLGVLRFRTDVGPALPLLERADQSTSDPYVQYLARYFQGQALERERQPADAEAAYRAALDTIPRAQSATFALAALLAARGVRGEAAALIDDSLTVKPRPVDPWRTYAEADDRFWPDLIAKLRAEIQR